jgi:predicted negative regulator of RcsB-dependent stress response
MLLARGLAQLEVGDTPSARATLTQLQKLAQPTTAGDETVYAAIMATMLEGATLVREGKRDEGIALLRKASEDYEAQPFDFGPPATVKPPRELLGELLLSAGRNDEAVAEFDKALASAPQRRASIAGRVRAGGKR